METYFDASAMEQAEIWRAVQEVKEELDSAYSPQGYNVGFNTSQTAGQTVMHLHIHVIPRYDGDVDDPPGGIRAVIPNKKQYESTAQSTPTVRDSPEGSVGYGAFASLPRFVGGEEEDLAGPLRHALRLADQADIVAAFVQPTGLALIRDDLRDALSRETVRIRLLTGDYMNTTSPDALREMLSLQAEFPARFEPYFFLGGGNLSFHAKAYIFSRRAEGVAYVGSSNLTKTALTQGIEWNLRAITSTDQGQLDDLRNRFSRLLRAPQVVPLTREIVDRYGERARIPEGPDPRTPPPPPHDLQREALDALTRLREEGARAGLVVMATGLGKTYLSALDARSIGAQRALFIAHRDEILNQALESWQRVFPEKISGSLAGETKEPDVDILFASVQTLARKPNLRQFDPEHFDYIVVDEFHHAAASTYRKVLAHFEPKFLLGLTATPDRMDGASILELCNDNLAYRAGLVRGIASKLLVPFRYFGVKDEVDFETIPWRGRWPIEELTNAVVTRERAEQALREYRKHSPPGKRRTLAFCCSVAHANFMAEYFRSQGIAAVAVHSEQATSAPRSDSLRKLRNGELEILCAVDVFNEGLDVPDINVVLMLRPTESPVIFLQQLGRGLRRPETSDKAYLTIVDFIGNHRSFLIKPQALVALTGQDLAAGAALEAVRSDRLDLPEGCHVDIETEAIEMLERVGRLSREDMLVYEYVSLRDAHGRRPRAAEVLATGVHMKPVRDRYGNWFDFVHSQGDLGEPEQRALNRYHTWFDDLMKTSMTRSYKMVTLKAMLDMDVLRGSVSVPQLVRQAHRILNEDMVLRQELEEVEREPDPITALQESWRSMPLKMWAGAKSTTNRWFNVDDDSFRFMGEIAAEDADVFDDMTAELVDLRLSDHRNKLRSKVTGALTPIRIRVSHSSGKPILRFDRDRFPNLPAAGSDQLVEVDGDTFFLGFRKIAVNTAVRELGGVNELPALMRRWFGPTAGQPGSRHFVLLSHHADGWKLEPETDQKLKTAGNVIAFPALSYYSEFKVACGAFERGEGESERRNQIHVGARVPLDPKRHFVVRVSGNSMNGGSTPIADGDLALCEWLSATTAKEVEGLPCLVTTTKGSSGTLAALKIPVHRDGVWMLRSANPSEADQPITGGVTLLPVARFVEVVEEIHGPTLWGTYDREDAVALFGVKNDRSWQVGHRDIDVLGVGHSILFVKLRKGVDTPASQRYADKFISPREFQWESQASTTPKSKKGRNIIEHPENGRHIHLFCRYDEAESFTYCGELRYLRHHGSNPIRVWFQLEHPLPDGLWRLWST